MKATTLAPAVTPAVILASASKQRNLLMESLGIAFRTLPADIDEAPISSSDPAGSVRAVAQAKAQAILSSLSTGELAGVVLIAADSCVVADGVVLEKPQDTAEASEMLERCSGAEVTGHTGFVYYDLISEITMETTVTGTAQFRELSQSEIRRYASTQPVTTWAGGFSPAYPEGASLLLGVSGSFTGFTHGFPMELVIPLLQESGQL